MDQLPDYPVPSPTSGTLTRSALGVELISPLSQLLLIPQLPAAMALLWETLGLHPRPSWAPLPSLSMGPSSFTWCLFTCVLQPNSEPLRTGRKSPGHYVPQT